jgi:hypothetical protein
LSDVEIRATHAQQLLDDPLLAEVFSGIRQAAVDAWVGTASGNTEARELAWVTVKVIDRIKAEFESMVENGLIAASRIQAPLR